jgi:hypothetical protein
MVDHLAAVEFVSDVTVRAYRDSAVVAELFRQNPV